MTPKEAQNRVEAMPIFGHARKCKKILEQCPTCQSGMKWFKTLPPMELSDTLREAHGTW